MEREVKVLATEAAQRLVSFYARGVEKPTITKLYGYAGRAVQVIEAVLLVRLSVRQDGDEISFYVDPRNQPYASPSLSPEDIEAEARWQEEQRQRAELRHATGHPLNRVVKPY